MHFLMTALGSYGDVHPIAGLGKALRQRGHDVSIVANPHFRPVIEAVDAAFLPLGTSEEYAELADNPDLWHPVRGPMLVMKVGVIQYLRELYELLEANYRPGESVLVAHTLDMAGRIMHEKHGAPLATIILAPLSFRSYEDSPQMFGMLMQSWVPRWLRKAQYWVADRLAVDPLLGPPINELRAELGLPGKAEGIFRDWFFSPQLVLGLFPEWFAPPQLDWAAQIRLTGFPLWDEPNEAGLPTEVDEFLRGGEPPIVFTPGSAMAHGQAFFQAAVDACQMLGRRGVLLTKYPEQLPRSLPDDVRHFSFVPFSQLLPQSAAVVHHGGIGSSAQGLAAAVPQLVMPMAYDQRDNAARLASLGVSDSLRPKKFKAENVARKLERLLTDATVHERCHHWAKQCHSGAALSASCELLEGLGA